MKKQVQVWLAVFLAAGACAGAPFRLATWNVGHWSNGAHNSSTIRAGEEEQAKSERYQKKLDVLGADWFGVCEYSSNFVQNATADAAERVFRRYPLRQVGPSHNYQGNAVFHSDRFKVLESKVEYYPICHQKTYAYAHRVLVDGAYEAWFVQTHLDFYSAEIRAAQVSWLVENYGDKDRVVISGDFNTSGVVIEGLPKRTTYSDYELFAAGGFSIANPSGATFGGNILDNILVKGFAFSDLTVFAKEGLSDHDGLAVTLEPLAVGRIAKPKALMSPVYDGKAHAPTVPANAAYAVSCPAQTEGGTYSVTVSLKDKSRTVWEDGTTEDVVLSFVIVRSSNDWLSAQVNRRDATADFQFAATNQALRLCVAWGGRDYGGATNAWPNVEDIAEIPAATTELAHVAVPREALRAAGYRFFLVDVYDSSTYVLDGLKVQWDALENAGRGRYDAAAKVWKNLADDVNDLSVSGCSFTGDALNIPSGAAPSVRTSVDFPRDAAKTVEGVLWIDDGSITAAVSSRVNLIDVCHDVAIMARGKDDTFTCALFVGQDGKGYSMTGKDLSRNSLEFLAHPQTYSVVNRPQASDSTMRINGAPYLAGNATSGDSVRFYKEEPYAYAHSSKIALGNARGALKVGTVRIYNRALTDAERDWNAHVDRVRYCGESAPAVVGDYFRGTGGSVIYLR